jgi:hypothetical protein
MDELERKRKYMIQLLREPEEYFKAGLAAYPERDSWHTAMAMKVGTEWVDDFECLQIKKDLIEEFGEAFFLPSKGDLAREIWATAKGAKTNSDKIKGLELYGKVMNFIEQPQPAQIHNNVGNTTNKVMLVTRSNSDDEWEQKLLDQQTKLIEHAS